MAFPVTLNGRTYTLTDFEGTNYVDGLPDAFEDFVTQAGQIYSTTSTTSNSIGTGSKTFTVEASKPYQVGTPLRIADTAAVSTNWIDGIVTAYSGTTLTVDAVAYAGSGTKTAWSINIGGGPIAYTGTLPIAQGGTGATDAAGARTNIDVYSKADADSRFLNVSGEASDVVLNGDLTVDTDTLYVDSANNRVGINTTSPSAELHVNSGAANFTGLFESTDSGATISLIDNGTTGGSAAEHGLNTVGDQLEIRAVDNLSFETATVERMRLDSVGKLSLGTDLTNADSSLLHITSGSSENFAMLQLENTNAGSSTAPDMAFYRNSASPADDDNIGALHFYANNSAGTRKQFGSLYHQLIDVTDGTEDAKFRMDVMKDGTLRELLTVGSAEVIVNEESEDVNFRVESNNDAAAFFVDGADGNIGMSTNAPSTIIPTSHNAGVRSFVSHNTGGSQIVMSRSDTVVEEGDYIGGYLFKTNDAAIR